MFKWFKKKEKDPVNLCASCIKIQSQDAIEESLWEIKEEYDIPTEEVLNVVESKRRNIEHMHKMLSKKEQYE
jgi:Zn-finger protein